MKIQKNAAVALFVALGLKNADKWNEARLSAKLGKIKEMVDEDVKLEGAEQELLTGVMAAAAAGEEFEIEGGEPTTAAEQVGDAAATEKAQAAPKQTDEEKAAAKAAKEAEKAKKEADKLAAKAAKEKEAAEKKAEKARLKAEKEAAAKAAKEPKTTRPGICGEVLKARGLSLTVDVKIDEALAATVDELYGKTNPNESLFALRNAKNAILGYLASKQVDVAPATE
jgi:membrane protein involved in colicin uptake